MKALYEMIHARAMQTWMGAINRESYDKWAKHWIGCAVNIESEMKGAGLLDTAAELRKIIDVQSKYSA